MTRRRWLACVTGCKKSAVVVVLEGSRKGSVDQQG